MEDMRSEGTGPTYSGPPVACLPCWTPRTHRQHKTLSPHDRTLSPVLIHSQWIWRTFLQADANMPFTLDAHPAMQHAVGALEDATMMQTCVSVGRSRWYWKILEDISDIASRFQQISACFNGLCLPARSQILWGCQSNDGSAGQRDAQLCCDAQ